LHILDLVSKGNIVPDLDQKVLDRIGAAVVSDYDTDKRSMQDWLDRNALALKLIDQKPEVKNDPWPNSASTKLPLVLNAAMRSAAEEYAEILRGDELVKADILGSVTPGKEARGQRVTKLMNYQIYHDLEDWEEDHDRLILVKNILGTVHKKYFYADGKIQCVLRLNGVVINDNVMHLRDAPRITDEIEKFWWQAEEKFRLEEWTRFEITNADSQDFAQADKLNLFLEQIRREDLDDDGYPEPYVVTVHKQSRKVVRITPNYPADAITFNEVIDYAQYQGLDPKAQQIAKAGLKVKKIATTRPRVRYVKYSMIPSWEGGYWDFGYGILLGPLNENCNQLVNQLLNAGHLANKGGGFINSGVKIPGGTLKFSMNEWKVVQSPGMDLARNIVPLPVKEPSQTLFSTLGLLMETLRELSAVSQVMSGEQPRANMPAASVLALLEQGKKMFNSVYKRHYRALNQELLALFDLNFLYTDPKTYIEFHDLEQKPVPPEVLQGLGRDPEQAMTFGQLPELWVPLIQGDYEREGLDILPTANPEFSSRMQRMAESQALLGLKDDPRTDGTAIIRRYVEGIVDDTEIATTLVPEQPQMTPLQILEQIDLKVKEILAGNEARKSEATAKIEEIKLQREVLAAQKDGIKLPLDVEKAALAVEKAGLAVENVREQGDLIKLQQQLLALEARLKAQEAKQSTTTIRSQGA